jgi:hypothetical protein
MCLEQFVAVLAEYMGLEQSSCEQVSTALNQFRAAFTGIEQVLVVFLLNIVQ